MSEILRTLVYGEEVSLTLARTTDIVNEGIRLHGLTPASAYVYGKAMSVLAYMSACLKEESGELSLTFQCEGEGVDIGASGNRALNLRGYIGNARMAGEAGEASERRALGYGSLTVVRDDGYNRPFVGACAFPENGGVDEIVEEYYRISEQIPTRIRTMLEMEGNVCTFAGIIVLQPLPFASADTLQKIEATDMESVLSALKNRSAEEVVRDNFSTESSVWELREAQYRCNCSREYLTRVLVTLGEGQLRDIIRDEGAVRVHCHYCNSDYEFTEADADRLFPKKV